MIVPILNVIDPSINKAIKHSKTKCIGVIGTETTVLSNSYQQKIVAINQNIKVVSQSCPLFVPIIEEGWIDTAISREIAGNVWYTWNAFFLSPFDNFHQKL